MPTRRDIGFAGEFALLVISGAFFVQRLFEPRLYEFPNNPRESHNINYIGEPQLSLDCSLIYTMVLVSGIYLLVEATNNRNNPPRPTINTREYGEESSMKKLTSFEKKVFKQAIEEFRVKEIRDRDYKDILKIVRKDIEKYYQQKPATIKIRGKTCNLPLSWKSFQQQFDKLSPKNYNRALSAYYKHEVHSTYRFLLKPNPWMASDAGFVEVNENDEKTSCYEDFKLEILTCFLVAKKLREVELESNSSTAVESEVLLNQSYKEYHPFYSNLALIARAHNWDESQSIIKNNKLIKEEYDDLRGDDPSCSMGVLRRLYQIVAEYYQSMNTQLLNQAIQEFVVSYYIESISPSMAKRLYSIYSNLINLEEISSADYQELSERDLSKEKINSFLSGLKKSKKNLPDDFKEHVQNVFKLKDPEKFKLTEPFNCFHLLKFPNLFEILEKKCEESNKKNEATASVSQKGFFSHNISFLETNPVENIANFQLRS